MRWNQPRDEIEEYFGEDVNRWDAPEDIPDNMNDPDPVQKYGVTDEEKAYWNGKQDALEYDAEPTQYSDKHLISGAIYNALNEYKVSTVQECQAFYYTIAGGLAETRAACAASASAANISETNAAASEHTALSAANAASLSESNASASETHAANSATNAENFMNASQNNMYDAEAWATGTRNGVPVPPTDPTYQNNARYYVDRVISPIIDDSTIALLTTWSSNKLNTILTAKADLEDGKVPATQLPSYVDDVKEYPSISDFPNPGESGKIYIATNVGKEYRWSGTGYAIISESLALGETASTAYAGNKGKANANAISTLNTAVGSLRANFNAIVPSDAAVGNKLITRSAATSLARGLIDTALIEKLTTYFQIIEIDGEKYIVYSEEVEDEEEEEEEE